MHRIVFLSLTLPILALAASGCRTSPWQTADAETGARTSLWPAHRYSAADHLPETEPEPRKTPELSLATARYMEGIGNLIEARQHYEDVIDESPKQVDALLGLARIDQLSGRTHQAEQGFLAALRLEPNSPVVLHALGMFYQSEQRWSEAVNALNKAMLAAPTEAQYRQDLAVALVHTGDLNGARTHFVRTVGDAAAHYNIGLILHEIGQIDAAEQQMLLAVTKQPNLQHAQYWLDEIRREREAAWAMQESLAESAETHTSPIRQTGHDNGGATPVRAARSGHSLSASPAPPAQTLTPQQRQQLQNQR